MPPARSAKPLVSALVALAFVLAFVMPFLSYAYLAGPITPFDKVQAGAIRYGLIGACLLVWLGIQLFWHAPVESTKLSLAASATIFWLSLALFFGFKDANFTDEGYRGAAAFFTLMGGLGIVLIWTRFLSDEISY
ncbi:MAG TPA: hypothetical protein VJN88_04270 [Ktedonobacterales bacterium]|nr:hypothetical protein [Ktedonobacterales bacterium]